MKASSAAIFAAIVALQLLSAVFYVEALSTSSATTSPSSASSSSSATSTTTTSKILRSSRDYHLLEVVPHDASSFTQGLTYFGGHIYEGTGLEQESTLLRHDPTNQMKTLTKVPLTPTHLFGEGISHYSIRQKSDPQQLTGNTITKEHRLIQLTWKNKVGKIYSLPQMDTVKEFTYDTVTGEGWGITFVEHTNEFYVSDGSDYLMVWDAETLVEKRRIRVTFQGNGARYLNELEFVDFAPTTNDDDDNTNNSEMKDNGDCVEDGSMTCSEESTMAFTPTMKILANIWYQDVIVSIDPVSGEITRVYDMRDIYPVEERQKDRADCLNGISVTGARKKDGEGLEVWVTGKLWPKMYRVQLID